VNRQAQAVILLLVGGAVLRASLTDPFLVAAGLLLVVAAVMTLWYELRGTPDGHGSEHGHGGEHGGGHGGEHGAADDGHGHGGEPWVAWLLVLPVFALLLVAPAALGSYAAGRSGTVLQQTSDFPPLASGDPVKISMLDYATRAVFDHGRSLANRHVQVTGFVMAQPDGSVYLARMVLTCCAADARPVKVGLTGAVPTGLKPDAWLTVTGTYAAKTVKDSVNGETIPYLDVSDAQVVPEPDEQYES
jgi:uncharacterized repeat protein (TIGR03943 family)